MDLTIQQQNYLTNIFGNRVNFDPRERRFYANDVGTMPAMVKRLMGKHIPAGIIQPVNQEEVVILTKWAAENRIPLIPRGKATSGYGGVVPVKGGLIVEFNRMKKILVTDTGKLTVTVEPGAVWQKVQEHLNEKGLTLKSYPTSAPSSTVAGWLATGGAGIGSYQSGYFRDSVIEITMVAPDGKVDKLSGDKLSLVENASGITGFITSIKFAVAPIKDRQLTALAFNDLHNISSFVNEVYQRQVPLWSLSFTNPEISRYRNLLPASAEHGKSNHHVSLPEKYILLAVYDSSLAVNQELQKIAVKFGGTILDESIARHEWEERFNPMKAKRISPSLIPAEVVVPVMSLAKVMENLEARIHQPFLLEAFAVKGGEIVLLGFIPHDERKFGFNMAFGLSLTVLKTALQNGGRPYGNGLYFSAQAKNIFGNERIAKLKEFKAARDKSAIMNPGKTIEVGSMAKLISMALPMEGVIRPAANSMTGNQAGEGFKSSHGLPDDVTWFSYACAGCGYCVDECTQYYGRGWESQSPRGKWSLLKMVADGETNITQQDVSTFLACTTCDLCRDNCQLELPIEPSWLKLRGQLVHDEGFHSLPAFHIMAASARKERNIWAHYAQDRDAWVPEDMKDYIKEKSNVAYFPGCTASYVEQDIAVSTARLLQKAGVEFTYLGKEEACCGIPMLMSGKWDEFKEIMDHNIAAMKAHGATEIITSCPACRLVWETYYRRWSNDQNYPFHARHYSEVIAEKIASGEFKPDVSLSGTVTYHDPCHMGRASGVYEEPRELLKAIPGIEFREMKYNRDKAHCCGSVLTLVANPDTAADIGKVRLDEALDAGADTIITACPCCRVQLQATADYHGMKNLKVKDLAAFTAQACGYEIPDSTPELKSSWAIFDIMIRMLTPSGMAGMMAEMLDDMIEAMP
ncbi:MAG TPA: FAD-binding and (Fe-S)-binding domain-containing protein, partial [Syntrophomonadaceae bacterium]|nr:FAD-binding and (Fe-S)-binding domain-containing protein [Syntrophomonadaceae bacterium]